MSAGKRAAASAGKRAAASAARRGFAGRSSKANDCTVSFQTTPRSSSAPARRTTTCGGIASSTSFSTTAPSILGGTPDSHSTRPASAGAATAIVARCRSREVGAHLDDRVARRQRAARVQRDQQVRGEAPGAGAELDDLAAGGRGQDRVDLHRQRRAEERRHLRRGDEVAGGAELARAGRVIAQPRRVQHVLQVVGERHPPAGRVQFGANAGNDAGRVRAGVGVGFGQRRSGTMHREGGRIVPVC